MPPPEILAQYDGVVPGAGERILQMAEREQLAAHRTIQSGQRGALVAALFTLTVVAVLGYFGHADAARWIGTTTVLGLVAAFLAGRGSRGTPSD